MVDYRIDSHKLIYHPERVADWIAGNNIYPICMEISPSSSCNHRCQFCAFDYLAYKPIFLDKDLILNNLHVMATKGVKSIVLAGSGEPLLNPATPAIINGIKDCGMDVAMSSNGVLFTKATAEECLASLTWVRFSVNGGTTATYSSIHGGHPNDFETVLSNLQDAVAIKRNKGLQTTLGVQLLLIPDNISSVYTLSKLLKEIGVDYFTVKPYSQHPQSINELDTTFDYQACLDLDKQLSELSTNSYRVFFRSQSMKKLKKERQYNRCLGLPFWAYIDANADVWACLAYVGNPDFCYGSLREQSFMELWEGKKRSELMAHIKNMDVSKCRELCRLDEINTYLDQLKKSIDHVNFI